ncbi:hypothetical protein D3C72_2055120 [compost metagenome]
MRLGALTRRPGFQQLTFFAQLREFALIQIRSVADPDVHVALIGLRQGAKAAHQEQAMNRSRRITAMAWLVGKRAGQALGFGQEMGVRLEIRQPGRCAARNVTWQQRMVDVEKQR